MLRPKTCLKEVIPEECNRQRASRAQNTQAIKQQVVDVSPHVFSVCVSTMSRPKIRTQGENTFLAQTAQQRWPQSKTDDLQSDVTTVMT